MNNNNKKVSISKLVKAFEKIYKGLNKMQITAFETEELFKIVPSEETEVFMASDYDDEENSMGVSLYVSKPLANQNPESIRFDKIMFECLVKADTKKFSNIMQCINLMERKGTDNYSIDYIPVSYDKKLGDYYIQYTITKELE